MELGPREAGAGRQRRAVFQKHLICCVEPFRLQVRKTRRLEGLPAELTTRTLLPLQTQLSPWHRRFPHLAFLATSLPFTSPFAWPDRMSFRDTVF